MRLRKRAKSGTLSSSVSWRNDDRRAGSFSIVHIRASASLMRRSKRIGRSAMETTLLRPRKGDDRAYGGVDDHVELDGVACGHVDIGNGAHRLPAPVDRHLSGERRVGQR